MRIDPPIDSHFARVNRRFADLAAIDQTAELNNFGKLIRVAGGRLEVSGLKAGIGARCRIEKADKTALFAEVIGFEGDRLLLASEDLATGVAPGAAVRVIAGSEHVSVGAALLGRVLDGAGKPLDNRPLTLSDEYPIRGKPINPLQRSTINECLDTGVRAINALLTLGKGQRIGLFAGSGVGKSTLLGMITRFSSADVVVVSLVGERGREVKEFIEDSLGHEG